ncbi:MAG: hypothetical protein WBP29_12775 [Candidatus Zixiibacteriota bacterium]
MMKSKFVLISTITLIVVLTTFNSILLLQNRQLKSREINLSTVDYSSVVVDGEVADLRGIYTYPGIMKWLIPGDPAIEAGTAPLTLAVFFSRASRCPSRLAEVEVYKRLLPIFNERGQKIVAIVAPDDSGVVSEGLHEADLGIPLVAYHGADSASLGLSIQQLGISPDNMPFKILFDSTLTAVYIRGSDYTPESQLEFEQAMLRLSSAVYRGLL